jgi:hypothetical protein
VRRSPNNSLILGYDSVRAGINWLTFRRSLISPSGIEVASFSENSIELIADHMTSNPKKRCPQTLQIFRCPKIYVHFHPKLFHKSCGLMIRHWSRRRVERSAYRNRKHRGTKTTGAKPHHHHQTFLLMPTAKELEMSLYERHSSIACSKRYQMPDYLAKSARTDCESSEWRMQLRSGKTVGMFPSPQWQSYGTYGRSSIRDRWRFSLCQGIRMAPWCF